MGQYKNEYKRERSCWLTAAEPQNFGDDGIPFVHFLEADGIQIAFSRHEYLWNIGMKE